MVIQQTVHNLEQGDVALPDTGRPVVRSNEGVISSGHYLTSMAGMKMLMAGGNAFDAMVAASLAAAVVEPIASYSLLAEGVFMLYDSASGDLTSLNGQGGAPGAATPEFYRSRGHERIPTGPGLDAPLSFTQPGIVDAFIAMLERYGSLSFAEVAAPAISYAEDGIPHYEYMLERLRSPSGQEQFDNFPPGGWDVFYENREVPAPGALMVQPGLANTLKTMRDASLAESSSRNASLQAARDAFYCGPIARQFVDATKSVGGIFTMDDLAGYHSKFAEPVTTTFNGCQVWGQDTWTQGPMLMQALNILENFDLRAMGHNSPAYIHTVAETLKLCFGDREAFYGDPDFATVPIDGLLSKEYAAERAQLIDPEGAYPAQPQPGDPWKYSKTQRQDRSPGNGRTHLRRPRLLGRRRHHPRLRTGQARQPGVRHHQRRLLLQVGVLPRAWRLPQHPHRDVQLRTRPPQRRGTRQASAHHAGQLHRRQRRPARDDRGLPRRRQPGAGQPPAHPELTRLRHGPAAGRRIAPVRYLQQRQLLLSARVFSRSVGS